MMSVFRTEGMKVAIYTLLMLAALSPVAYAQIESTAEAETDTGGNNAGSGGTVETGDSAASVQTTNVVGEGGGTVKVEVRTETNGEVKTESIKKTVPGGVNVRVSASSSGAVKTDVKRTETNGKVTVTVQSAATGTSSAPFWAPPFMDIQALLKKLFSFLAFF